MSEAHDVLAGSCAVYSPTRSATALAKAVNSLSFGKSTITNAHTGLTRPYALTSLTRCSAALVKVANSTPGNAALPLRAAPYATFAIPLASTSPASTVRTVWCTNSSSTGAGAVGTPHSANSRGRRG